MKRIALWLLSTVAVVVLLFGYHTSTAGTLAAGSSIIGTLSFNSSGTTSAGAPPTGGSGQTTGSTAGNTSGNTSGSSGSAKGSGGGKSAGSSASSSSSSSKASGTVDGAVARTMWGPVQVEIVVNSGKITDVKMLQYPNGNSRDIQIDNYVLPILMKETISAQSAHIQMISGATYTSTGYVQSLQSALDKAGI